MHQGGLEIVDVDGVFDDVVAELVALAVGDSGFDATAGHPEGEGIGVMIATPFFGVFDIALEEGRPTEFTAPDDEGVFEEAAHFQIFDQRGGGAVGVGALDF